MSFKWMNLRIIILCFAIFAGLYGAINYGSFLYDYMLYTWDYPYMFEAIIACIGVMLFLIALLVIFVEWKYN